LELYLVRLFNVIFLFIVLQSSLIQDKPPLLEQTFSCVRMMHPSLALRQFTNLVDLVPFWSGSYQLLPYYLRQRTSHFPYNTSKHWKWHSATLPAQICAIYCISALTASLSSSIELMMQLVFMDTSGCSNYYNYS